MAGLPFTVTTEGEIALTAATAKTILQIVAPTHQRIKVRGFSVSFDGTSPSAEPVQVELVRQTSAGTMSSATPVKDDDSLPETIQATAQKTATSEPTTTDILRRYDVHPQTGYERAFADGELTIKGGGRLGLRCTAPAGVNVTGHINCEE
jgi:hypothetical protein